MRLLTCVTDSARMLSLHEYRHYNQRERGELGIIRYLSGDPMSVSMSVCESVTGHRHGAARYCDSALTRRRGVASEHVLFLYLAIKRFLANLDSGPELQMTCSESYSVADPYTINVSEILIFCAGSRIYI